MLIDVFLRAWLPRGGRHPSRSGCAGKWPDLSTGLIKCRIKKVYLHSNSVPGFGDPKRVIRRNEIALVNRAMACWLGGRGAQVGRGRALGSGRSRPFGRERSPPRSGCPGRKRVFRKLTIDDRGYPHDRRVREHIRYKIFDPEKATSVTRISGIEATVDGERRSAQLELRARLIASSTAAALGVWQRVAPATRPGQHRFGAIVAPAPARGRECGGE